MKPRLPESINSLTGNTESSSGIWERHWRWCLLTIFLLALVLRVSAVVRFPAVPYSDAAHYHQLATDLARGRGLIDATTGLPTALRPIGYPAFLAGIYLACGVSPHIAYLIQALLGSVTVLLFVSLGWLIFGRREALLSGLLAAIYPSFIWLSRILLSENLALPLLLAALCAAALLLRTNRHRFVWAAILGVLLGLSVLVRGNNMMTAVLLLIGLVISFWVRRAGWRDYISVGIVLGTLLIVMFPWAARNYFVFHRIVPLATSDGMTFYGSYWPPRVGSKRIYGNHPLEDPAMVAASQTGDEAKASSYLRKLTLQRLRDNPRYYFQLLPRKLLYMMAPFDWEIFPRRPGVTRSFDVGYALMLVLALFGVWHLMYRRVPHLWLLWLTPASVLLQTLIFYGGPRYRLPADLTIILLASVGLIWMLAIARRLMSASSKDRRVIKR